jgi:hypothetical protein
MAGMGEEEEAAVVQGVQVAVAVVQVAQVQRNQHHRCKNV